MPDSGMTPEQQDIFRRYVELGDERTLKRLYEAIREEARFSHLTFRQLSRLSNKFKWSELTQQVSAHVVAQAIKAAEPLIVSMVQKQIEGLHVVQRRFLERLAIDPANPTLTPEQRSRALDPDFKDFQEAVKLERLILGDPTERKEIITAESRLIQAFSKEELLRLALAAASQRYGAVVRMPDDIEGEVVALPSGDDSNG
jgi:hypothetical protein